MTDALSSLRGGELRVASATATADRDSDKLDLEEEMARTWQEAGWVVLARE